MKINNKGNVSEFGGENGDLIIYFEVKNHKYFNRVNDNIVTICYLTIS